MYLKLEAEWSSKKCHYSNTPPLSRDIHCHNASQGFCPSTFIPIVWWHEKWPGVKNGLPPDSQGGGNSALWLSYLRHFPYIRMTATYGWASRRPFIPWCSFRLLCCQGDALLCWAMWAPDTSLVFADLKRVTIHNAVLDLKPIIARELRCFHGGKNARL